MSKQKQAIFIDIRVRAHRFNTDASSAFCSVSVSTVSDDPLLEGREPLLVTPLESMN
jgi:hypothetical protein